jgi:hypothetical protein
MSAQLFCVAFVMWFLCVMHSMMLLRFVDAVSAELAACDEGLLLVPQLSRFPILMGMDCA